MDVSLDALEAFLTGSQAADDWANAKTGPSGWQWVRQFLSGGGEARWLSVFDLVKIVTIYKEAVVEHYQSKQKIRTYDFAKNVNLYGPIQETLKKQARSANDEEAHKYLEYLQKEGFTYIDVFKPGGLLDIHRGSNINRTKAVLEYAADRAWLYKLDRHDGHNVYGVDFQGAFGRETFRELVQRNEAGKSKEEKRGKERVDAHPDIAPMIRDLEEELEEYNIFACKGIAERIQEKGKEGDCNCWVTTTLMRAMRKNPALLKLMDIGFLDDLGNIGIGSYGWTLTQFKTQRDGIRDWQRRGDGHFERSGELGAVIYEVESLIRQRNPSLYENKPALDRAVAKVLAGQTLADEKISLWQNNSVFSQYRKKFAEKSSGTPVNVKKTDPDFFSPADGSDVLLISKLQIKNLLYRQSTADFQNNTEATGYLTMILERYDELERLGMRDAVNNFRKEMCERIEYWLADMDNSRRAGIPYTRDLKNRRVTAEFHRRGIISPEWYNFLEEKKEKRVE